ncbi:MAG TPA: glycosyltransferase [Candidatus Acidoferrales bacterium]|jgi:cellulose synthase/poly-beta-1,6-N-acetylglucosamine synthase-like glycosyltransferase|nr:glycosyltransferase [Candidatus Acidoferrales bacterium]
MFFLLKLVNNTLFFYYVLSNIAYLCLLLVAIWSSMAHQRRLGNIRLERMKLSPLMPPISVLVPARNEEKCVVDSARSLLQLDYPELELIVINDGSTDGTLDALRQNFQLLETDMLYVPEVACKPVRGVYMSQIEPRLLVVDKEPGGSKADAINAGLNAASSPYVCVVDGDSILERDALLRIMLPMISDPKRVVAAGGLVRALNGSLVENGRMKEVRLPRGPVEVIQVVEYLRAFLIGREGWAYFNSLVIISGAFGIFRRDLLREIGGYRPAAIGEDIDVVTRMHRHLREKGADYRIAFVPDPVCWTEVPPDYRSLARQRARWQKGLLDVLWLNRDMLFAPGYGRLGFIALPYQWVFELVAPVIEIAGLISILTAAIFGALSRQFFVEFLIFGYAFATMISIGSVLLEEITYRRYNRWLDMVRLVIYCLFEHFPYRQFHMLWRLRGMWEFFHGDVKWGALQRAGFGTAEARQAGAK